MRKTAGLVVAAMAIALMAAGGCGQSSETVGADSGSEVAAGSAETWIDAQGQDAGADQGITDVGLPDDDAAADFAMADVAELDSGFVAEPGGPGYPCQSAADCNEGFCIQTPDGKQCTMTCEDECPFDWRCALYTPSLPDQIFICVPAFLSLCTPCTASSQCWTGGVDAGEACVSYGGEGLFCGAACTEAADCPAGHACMVAADAAGGQKLQCVLQNVACPCSTAAADAGAATTCFVQNEWGKCSGDRACTATGLSACSAAVPEAETCDSADNDCDGQVDEGTGGTPCPIENIHGVCEGVSACVGGVFQCNGPTPAPEVCDGLDNDCNGQQDEGFPDTDGDGVKDCLVADKDGDGVVDGLDNCPGIPNPPQADNDLDGTGDACDLDDDNDQVADTLDCAPLNAAVSPKAIEACNGVDDDCDLVVDEGFPDFDSDKLADCIDDDDDGDGMPDVVDCAPKAPEILPGAKEQCNGIDDNCDDDVDEGFPDLDADGQADCVDPDLDGDGVKNATDNCPAIDNPNQEDLDGDGAGDACDTDADGDAIPDKVDNCPGIKNTAQTDTDGDGLGNSCDDDLDGDGKANAADNCPLVANPGQQDADNDGVGDACEADQDGDGVPDVADCAPADPAVKPGAAELCDDIDNDCDGTVDEGFPDSDSDGLKNCIDGDDDNDGDPDDLDCAPLDPSIGSLAKEVCDGVDNDCDDLVDEGLGKLTCGLGQCAKVVDKCKDGALQVCNPFGGASAEVCDGDDNDCDGLIDEDLGTLTCGKGACAHSTPGCLAGKPQVCDPTAGASQEVCNNADDDCNGKVDDGLLLFACGKGQCFHTTPSCVGGAEQTCDPMQGAKKEVCDGEDNDCDGLVDEELGTATCGLGACSHTVDNCVAGTLQTCNPFTGAGPETCDGVDNDCDGVVDDELGLATCGLGVCAHTVKLCLDGQPQACDPFEGAVPEVCNGLDDDCNGQLDEGLGSTVCGLGLCEHGESNCKAGQAQECDPLKGMKAEACNGLDDDCDGLVDNGFADFDKDGTADCVDTDDDNDGDPDTTDCAPLDPAASHNAKEICSNGVDDDCNVATPDQCVLASCKATLAAKPGLPTGSYTIDPDGTGPVQPFVGYCDMTTDGGGWLLLSTQKPDGALYATAPVTSVVWNKGINQKYTDAQLAAFAAQAGYQVMVEENSGPDADAGLIMAYKMPKGIPLRFDAGKVAVDTVQWQTANKTYVTVNNNASGNWWGISVHGDAFLGLASDKRCIKKNDFNQSGGSNGDYKLDHQGTHSGTTRCVHGTVGIGVTHWWRPLE